MSVTKRTQGRSGGSSQAGARVEGQAGARISNRERLLDAAVTCLQEKGYARTTARDLVAVSGTNLASIGYHFGSKEQLLEEALGEAMARWTDPLIEIARRPGHLTMLERLKVGLRGFLDSLQQNRPIVTALYEALAQTERSQKLRRRMAEAYQRPREAIAAIIRDAAGPALKEEGIEPEAVASMVIAIVDGLMLQWYLDPDRLPAPDELIGSATSILPLVLQES